MTTISRRTLLRRAGRLPIAAAAPWVFHSRAASRKPPNFVFLLADDLGAVDLGCYGSTFHQTPHLDRLARQGMQFTAAYAACPVCSPTRGAIMTGKYPPRLGVTNFIPGNQNFPHTRLIAVRNRLFMDPAEVTIAETLKSAGYATACIGKWHLGAAESDAGRQGFDLYVTRGRRSAQGAWTGHPLLEGAPGDYITDRFTKTALSFIRRNRRQPFFLYLAYHNPHIPLVAKPEYVEKYKTLAQAGAPQSNPLYAAILQSLDDSAGAILSELDALNLAENTLVIFTSDNGGLTVPEWDCQIATSNAPFREGKGHLYEGGIRVPLLVRWPGIVRPGSRCDTPVTSTDFYPTMVEAAGIASDPGNPLDGVSLLPLFRQVGSLRREAVYWHYPHYSNQLGRPGGAIRQRDYKLIEFYEDGRLELYNLADDPGETRDLAKQTPDHAAELHRKLAAWRKTVGAKMPRPNPNYDPAREWHGLSWYEKCSAWRAATGR